MAADTNTIACDGTLTIARAEELRETLLSALDQGCDVLVDCSGAAEVDLSFLQLLLAARSSAARRGVALKVSASGNQPLLASLRASGLWDGVSVDEFWVGVR
jgi:anti-anti-sigma regulatory factor